MSLTYIVLNLLLQNELGRKKKESDSYDKMINVLLIQMEALYMHFRITKIENHVREESSYFFFWNNNLLF